MSASPAVATEEPRFLAGGWLPSDGPERPIFDPATGQIIATVADATAQEVDAAVMAGKAAQRKWARLPAVERGQLLTSVAERIDEGAQELAAIISAEVGKPISQARGEVRIAAEMLRFTAEWARRLQGDVVPSDLPSETITLLRVPVGVVGAICAWNFPLALYARKVGPALLAGNTVIVKPSELTPLSAIALTRIVQAAGLPPGVLNLVCGGPEAGRAITTHPDVGLITMTGSRGAGQQILADAAPNLTRVSLELGGKAPAIITADADLDTAVPAIVQARHLNSGQVCTAAEIVYVDDRLKDEFTERYRASVAALRIGDPMSDPDMGPLASSAQLDKVRGAVDDAAKRGATVIVPHAEDVAARRGYWCNPVILSDVTDEMAVVNRETFGPVTPIVGVGSLEEAFARTNASPYGLSAYVFTRDYRTAMRAAHELECGEVYINRGIGEALQAHHSGHRQSGLGGEDGIYGLLRYTQVRSVYHNFG
jgi:lactaldehyde dehydrogenase/glycolaldehyde dehydrogenase